MAVPGGVLRPLPLLLLLLGLARGVEFTVKNSNNTACIMANLSANFSVTYEARSGPKTVTFELPATAKVLDSNSSCGKENASDPILTIAFRGHTLALSFTRNATRYGVQLLRFGYSLSDSEYFPNASSNGSELVDFKMDIKADIDKKYRCVSDMQVHGRNVTLTLQNTTLQAYLHNGSFSEAESHCQQDTPSPTPAPPAPPSTSSPSPPPRPESPSVSRYNVSNNNETCLLASMGLQLNVTYVLRDNTTVTRVFNINPNKTTFSGLCEAQLVTLELHSSERNTVLTLQFGTNASASQYFLQGVKLNTVLPDAREPAFAATNNSLRALQATLGNSYKCNSEERVRVTPAFSLSIFRVWVQAFRVKDDKFGSVEECPLDQDSMLIPIAVGGALAGLVLIVLIAYLIGRKRSHAGYQTI
ncbi:lysosome-associated membrane glycoprotein 1 [Ochotona princeps]|uniref:lysosome-associated membrane glycoprotein 1 n=1 Tax=Ochotona princeps TaxID=9978 RepID=UPI0027146C43|nr:lysosome-associated membrane glycoprotein 1 [Ochotona princeps]